MCFIFSGACVSFVLLITTSRLIIILPIIQVDQENDESLYEEDEFSDTDSDSDNQSFFEDPANEVKLS